MRFFTILIFILVMSCAQEKVIQLPEVDGAEITEVLDVSPAYLFYNETQPDSVELNRKNLISTTNWLVNVDKRLTLHQAIPHIKFLQDKKRNAKMHKNENAKNYFTCNDISIKNLGFIEFTDINFLTKESAENDSENVTCHILFQENQEIHIQTSNALTYKTNKENFIDTMHKVYKQNENLSLIVASFDSNLSFQNYIHFKSLLSPFKQDLSKNEFIFHP